MKLESNTILSIYPLKHSLTVLFLVLLLSFTGCSENVAEKSDVQQFSEYLDEKVPQYAKSYDVSGVSIALIVKGDRVWSGYYGFADKEQKTKITGDTIFRTQSISKSVTAWALMRLVEQQKVDLDAPITSYLSSWQLPPLPYAANDITLRQLLSHTSGMQLGTIGMRYDPRGAVPTLKESLTKEVSLIKPPGTSFTYSNVGYNLIELIIEEVTSQDFAQFMDKEILAPLGMNFSSFTWDNNIESNLATGYTTKGRPVPPYVYPDKASGGLFATVDDLALFVSASMSKHNQQILTQQSLDEIYTPVSEITGIYSMVADGYGFGHFIEKLDDGKKAVWHGGQGYGWMSHFHSIPETGDGIVIITNSQRSWPLIAKVLQDWTHWKGLESVQMSRISQGITLMWILVSLLALASLLLAYRLVNGLLGKTRSFALFKLIHTPLRVMQCACGTAMIGAIIWASIQPYLMITSVFPGVSQWAGKAIIVLGGMCILSSVFPFHNKQEGSM